MSIDQRLSTTDEPPPQAEVWPTSDRSPFGIAARATVAARNHGGITRLTTMRSEPPLTIRPTPGGIHLVGSAAGPIGGDRLSIDIDVGPSADLVIRSAAASIVLPGPTGAMSCLGTDVSVRSGGSLTYLPEPTVLVAGCDHEVRTRIALDPGAALAWREEYVLGRHDEPGGSVHQRLRIDLGGSPLLRNDLVLGARWPGSLGPAGTSGHRVLATLVLVGPTRPSIDLVGRPGVRAAVLDLDGPGVVVAAIGDSTAAVRRVLDEATPR